MIRGTDDNTNPGNLEDHVASQHASSIGWVNSSKPVVHSWDLSSSDRDYMVRAVKHKKFTKLKVAGAQLPIRINGKASRVWIDSGSPTSIFTIGELRRTLEASGLKLDALSNDDTAFQDYGNNPLKLIGTMSVILESNGWKVDAQIKVVAGNRPSINGRDLLPQLGLQLVQQTPGDQIMSIDEEPKEESGQEGELDSWQSYFSKQFSNLFKRVGKIKTYKVQAEIFEILTTIQQKGRRVQITLQENVCTEIGKLLKQCHIEKLEKCSEKYFVSPIVITVKKDGTVKLALESRELK